MSDPNHPAISTQQRHPADQNPVTGGTNQLGDSNKKCSLACLKETATTYIAYDKLLIIDCVLAGIHLLFFLILGCPWPMLLTLIGIRAPRIFLFVYSKKINAQVWYDKELMFRKWTCLLYLPIALVCQALTPLTTDLCSRINSEWAACWPEYMGFMTVMLLIYMIIDVGLYLIVKFAYENRGVIEPKEGDQEKGTIKEVLQEGVNAGKSAAGKAVQKGVNSGKEVVTDAVQKQISKEVNNTKIEMKKKVFE